ncbi:putative DNA-binding transcriptional regulator YafY [Caldalkalibacillus uzonensis]|uniref:DNA-binding transcriptional regulator YafY n=1 Tax=Caldalkalibacillus uzonensis TaxID=353224 RepID=A0ABU0CXH0_9BACI|nr:transcriptional regulator [Caldalkalibacillus uzonensis]MDQ0340906.1 putative DNA-binding transcriptional regulator YafY [Caldalkalibacillus uzonensis]
MKTDRLFRLIRIITLVQSKPGIKARELAERCETTERTIYRDIDFLSAVHIPITNMGYGTGYQFVGNFALYPMDLTEAELMAFAVLPSLLEQVDLVPPDLYSAYDKVMAAARKEKLVRQELLDSVSKVIQMGSPAYKEIKTNFLSTIMQAILSRRTIEARYHTQSRNVTTDRAIDPYYLIPREHRFYLIGYCHQKQAIRTFRLSRFQEVKILNKTFEMDDFNLKAYLKETWSIERGDERITFKVRFSPHVARYVKEEELFVKPKLTDLEDGSLLFEVTLNHDREFLQWLMGYGAEAEILEPQSYRKKMRELLARWLQVYDEVVKGR